MSVSHDDIPNQKASLSGPSLCFISFVHLFTILSYVFSCRVWALMNKKCSYDKHDEADNIALNKLLRESQFSCIASICVLFSIIPQNMSI